MLSLFLSLISLIGTGHGLMDNLNNQGWKDFFVDEISEFHDVPLTWELDTRVPKWLRGSYIKNGPAQKTFDGVRYYGMYADGWAKLHRFTLADGRVWFSGRMLGSDNYKKCVAAGRMVPTMTLSPVKPNDWNLGEVLQATINGFDNANIVTHKLGNVNDPAGLYIATTDIPDVYEFDPITLEVKGRLTVSESLAINLASSAHWKRDVGASEHTSLNFYVFMEPLTMSYEFQMWRFGSNWKEKHMIGKFTLPHLSMVHQISNTPNYGVIVIYPVTMDMFGLAQHGLHPLETLVKLNETTKIYLMNLSDGSVIDGFETDDPALVFATHHVNAYEEDGEVIVDLVSNPWDSMATTMDLDRMLNWEDTGANKAQFLIKRLRLNLESKSVAVEDYENKLGISYINTFDFPLINPKFNGLKHRFVYGWTQMDYWRQVLIKKDLVDSSNDKTWFKPSHYPGEMFFVPNPEASDEDEGLLITVVFDGAKNSSYLLLLDAKTLEEFNYAYLPYVVPFSIHGNWFPNLVY